MGETAADGIRFFCRRRVEGGATDAAMLGHKGANLAEMARLGLPVPPGFTLDVTLTRHIAREDGMTPETMAQIGEAVVLLEEETGARFGGPGRPLLLAVRASTRRALPGLLPAMLNVGISRPVIESALAAGEDAAFLWDCYRRFLHGYGHLVLGMTHEAFEYELEDFREALGLAPDMPLEAAQLEELAGRYEELIAEAGGGPVPEEPREQLHVALLAAARAWNSPRVREAQRLYGVPTEWGAALSVQAMVFGNRDADSAAGVAVSRDPVSGEKALAGEYLPRAQGEDIVAGLRTPWPITEEERRRSGLDVPSMELSMPDAFAALLKTVATLERHYRKPQNIEFVVEDGRLWLLQALPARLGPAAALRAAVDMVREGLVSREDAILQVDPYQLEKLLHPVLERAGARALARGIGASPGAASGEVVIDAEEARRLAAAGRSVILVRPETTPEDIPALQSVRGILTARGGMTSHAAVIARGLGIPCVAGVGVLEIDSAAGEVRIGGRVVRLNEWITIDGASGEVFRGRMPTRQPALSQHFHTLLEWADAVRSLEVRANADTPREAEVALEFGAEGIGLCRTEHMFFGTERLALLQELILSTDPAHRRDVLQRLEAAQGEDFRAIFAVMAGRPVTIRLLDPPVHEFLPRSDVEIETVAKRLMVPPERIRARVTALMEYNPMLGHRGARLMMTQPALLSMQARAMFDAMRALSAEGRAPSRLEIMVPFIMSAVEMARMRAMFDKAAEAFARDTGETPAYTLGCMIELPSACMNADAIATHAAFFSFGTNDLTQTVLGLSRDDAGRFLHIYLEEGLLPHDPFVSLEEAAVLPFIDMAVRKGREAREGLLTSACGEHAGDPRSIRLLATCGLDAISCSPYRVPIARLAAAQAALRLRNDEAN